MAYRYLTTKREGPVEYLTLNRPEVRNAFNEEVIAELSDWAAHVPERAARDGLRVAVLAGSGKTFCAGAIVVANLASHQQVSYGPHAHVVDHRSPGRVSHVGY